jgi:hypothetical protein
MEKRIGELEKEVQMLRKELNVIKSKLNINLEREDNRSWKSNTVDDWMIKLVYPGIYAQKGDPSAGFPRNRRKTADQMIPGQRVFIYATTPVKKIIGLTKVTEPMKIVEGRWPYSVPLEWEVGPKIEGVTLQEVGLDIRPRPGDTVYGITEEIAQTIIQQLEKQKDLTQEQWELLAIQYRELYKKPVEHTEAIKKLRSAGMTEAADALSAYYAADGTRRGWDEVVEKGNMYKDYPHARSIIWPETYGEN